MVDISVANPSMKRRFAISIISYLKPRANRVPFFIADLCALLPINIIGPNRFQYSFVSSILIILYIQDIISNTLLDDVIDWIKSNKSPEDVFDLNQLEEWAIENEYVKQ